MLHDRGFVIPAGPVCTYFASNGLKITIQYTTQLMYLRLSLQHIALRLLSTRSSALLHTQCLMVLGCLWPGLLQHHGQCLKVCLLVIFVHQPVGLHHTLSIFFIWISQLLGSSFCPLCWIIWGFCLWCQWLMYRVLIYRVCCTRFKSRMKGCDYNFCSLQEKNICLLPN